MIGLFVLVLLWAIATALYFLPAGIAYARAHSKIASIFVLNLFLGWTFLFWVVALVWAVSENNVVSGTQPAKKAPAYDELF